VIETDPVFEVSDRVLDISVTTVVSLQLEHLALAIGDKGVVGVLAEQGELAAWRRPHPADDESAGRALYPGRPVGGLCDIRAIQEVQDRHPVGLADVSDRLDYGAFVELGGDAEAHVRLPTCRYDVSVVEAGVGT